MWDLLISSTAGHGASAGGPIRDDVDRIGIPSAD